MDTFICEKCDGHGVLRGLVYTRLGTPVEDYEVCGRCAGTGRLDWIENARGQKRFKNKMSGSKEWKDLNVSTVMGMGVRKNVSLFAEVLS